MKNGHSIVRQLQGWFGRIIVTWDSLVFFYYYYSVRMRARCMRFWRLCACMCFRVFAKIYVNRRTKVHKWIIAFCARSAHTFRGREKINEIPTMTTTMKSERERKKSPTITTIKIALFFRVFAKTSSYFWLLLFPPPRFDSLVQLGCVCYFTLCI